MSSIKVVSLLLLLFVLKLLKEFCVFFFRNREFTEFFFFNAILISTSSNFVSCAIRTFNGLWIKLQNCCYCPFGINRLELISRYQSIELI